MAVAFWFAVPLPFCFGFHRGTVCFHLFSPVVAPTMLLFPQNLKICCGLFVWFVFCWLCVCFSIFDLFICVSLR